MRVSGMNYKTTWEMGIKVYAQDVKKYAIIHEALGGDVITLTPPTLYRFGREFAEALSEVELPAIPFSQLPHIFEGCFEFLDHWIWVRMDKSSKVKTSDGRFFGEGTLAVFTISKQQITSFFGCPIGGDFTTVDTMLATLSEYEPLSYKDTDPSKFIWAINCLVYVVTGAPDLREYQPPTKTSPGTRREKDKLVQEFGPDPCILVSWNWKKPRRQVATAWEVSGHFWWAPVGQGKVSRELRWREGHLRTATKERIGE